MAKRSSRAGKDTKQSTPGKKMAGNINQFPAGSPETPGPINDPSSHPIDNVPDATDPRWGNILQAQGVL